MKSIVALHYNDQAQLFGVRTGGYPDELQFWQVDALALQHDLLPKNNCAASFHPDGITVATCGHEGVSLWDVMTGRELKRFASRAFTNQVTFSPNGRLLACTTSLGTEEEPAAVVEIWEADQGTLLESFTAKVDYFMSLAFSPDSTRVAAGGCLTLKLESRVFVWSLSDGEPLEIDSRSVGTVHAIAFSNDGRVIATGGDSLAFFDGKTGERLSHMEGLVEFGSYWGLLFLPDGNTLAACYEGHDDSTKDETGHYQSLAKVRLLEYPTGRDVQQLTPSVEKGITGGGGPFALSPDRTRLASVVHGAIVLVWDVTKVMQ